MNVGVQFIEPNEYWARQGEPLHQTIWSFGHLDEIDEIDGIDQTTKQTR